MRLDQIAESIQSIFDSSKNLNSLFKKMETCIIRIMGRYCKKVNIMILDESFTKDIKLYDKDSVHF